MWGWITLIHVLFLFALIVALLFMGGATPDAEELEELRSGPKPKTYTAESFGNLYDALTTKWADAREKEESPTLGSLVTSLLQAVIPLRSYYGSVTMTAEDQYSLDGLVKQGDDIFTLYDNTPEPLRKRKDVVAAVSEEVAELRKAVANFKSERSKQMMQELDRDAEFLHTKFHTDPALQGGTRNEN